MALIALGCSSDGDDEITGLESVESSTTSTTEATTTTTEATTTTLSEQAQAEADVAQLVTDFWLAPFDTSQNEYGAEYLTGLIAIRSAEYAESVTAEGQVAREIGQKTIEVTQVEVDLEAGQGTVDVCAGSYGEIVDLETLEQLAVEDPTYLTTSVYHVELTNDGWKISDLFPSQATNSPQLCEVTTSE